MNAVEIYNESQNEIKKTVFDALHLHYGWEKDANGKWVKGTNGREFPFVTNALRIKRQDYFIRKHLGATDKTHTFFNEGNSASAPFNSNYRSANLTTDKFYVITGLQLLESAGLVGAAISTLAFAAPAQTALLTGLVDFSVNGKTELRDMPVEGLFENVTGDFQNYFRFPSLVVLEPANDMKLDLKLPATVGDFWIDVRTKGFILETV